MKSLNRTLSLVLVLVMVFGLFGVASAATSFKDDSTIQYGTAVGVMTGIGAINGYTDGTFAPKGTITREEAAKMITYAILGPTVAKSLIVSNTGFSDIEAGRWSAPFIAYCVNKGIINGVGEGKFDPTANVTGYQLAKMLLAAAGYGKQGEFTGASWELNVATAAFSNHVFDDTKATNFGVAATREEAALYVYNALVNVDQVVWDKTTDAYKSASKGTIGKAIYGLDLATATTTVKTDMITGFTQNAEKTKTYVAGTTAFTADTYVFTPTIAQYGHKVDLYTGTSGAVYYVNDACKDYVVPSTVTTAAALKTALTKFNGGTMVTYANGTAIPKFTNSLYDDDGYATGNADVETAAKAPATGDTYVVYKNTVIAVKHTSTSLEAITVSIDKDKNVVATIDSDVGAVIYNNTKAYIATNGAALNKIVYAGTIDWTSFIVGYDATSSITQTGKAYFNCSGIGTADFSDATKVALTDIVKVAGTASAVNVAGNKLTVNGTSYDVNVATGDENTGLTAGGTSANFDAALLSGSYKFWINNVGKIFYIQTVTASDTSSYAPTLVNAMWKVATGTDAYGVTAYKYYAQVVTSDGKLGVYEISAKDSLKPAEAAVAGVSYNFGANDFTAHYYYAVVTGTTVAIKTTNAAYAVATVAAQTTITKTQVVIDDMYFTGNTSVVTVSDIAPANATATAEVKASAVLKSAMETQTFANQTLTVVYKTVSGTKVAQAVFVEGAYAGVTTDIYFIAKYNGQISTGTTPTYSYTAIKLGTAAPVNLVSTTSTGAGLVGTFKSIQTTATGDAFTSATTATLVASGAMNKVVANTRVVNDYYMSLDRGTTHTAVDKLATTAAVYDLRAAVVAGTTTAYTNVSEIPTGTYVFAVYNSATSATQTGLTTIFVVDGTSACMLTFTGTGKSLTPGTITLGAANATLVGTVLVSDIVVTPGATVVVTHGGTVEPTSYTLVAGDVITVTAIDGTVVVYTVV